ncbi:glycine cleavage system protein GcvH [bacterium]|nr:glycine cleavage system protein GcvH [bacterium]
MTKFPENLKYAKSHEWVQKLDDRFRVGVSTFAAGSMGDVTFVELPEVEDDVDAEDSPCVIETVKSSEDIINPITGTVAAINGELEDTPETVNSDCYGDGWLYEVKGTDASEYDALMTPEEYTKYVASLED